MFARVRGFLCAQDYLRPYRRVCRGKQLVQLVVDVSVWAGAAFRVTRAKNISALPAAPSISHTSLSWEGCFASQLGALMLLMLPAGLRQALGQGPSSSWLTPRHSCVSQTCAPLHNQYGLAWAIWGSSDIFVLSSRLFVFWQLPHKW